MKCRFIKTKALIGALVLCFTGVELVGQVTFIKRFPHGSATLPGGLIIEGEDFIVSGVRVPYEGTFQQNLFVSKWSSSGEPLLEKFYGSSETWYNKWPKTMVNNDDNHFVLAAIQDDGTRSTAVLWFDEQCDTVQSLRLFSPYLEFGQSLSDVSIPHYLQRDPFGNLYLTCSIIHPSNYYDFVVYKISPAGEKLWEYIYSTPADPDICYALNERNDSLWLGVYSADVGQIPHKLISLDVNTGEVQSQVFVTPPGGVDLGLFWELIDDDGNWIVPSSFRSGTTVNGDLPMLYKLNASGEFLWDWYGDGSYYQNLWQRIEHLVRTVDGNYVGGAQHVEPLGWGNGERYEAWIIKVDTQGELMWERKFYHEEGNCKMNNIHDLKATPDGGVIFCGDTWDCTEDGEPFQQGWLVKLDEYGCLVPGCHVGILEAEQKANFLVYPNPAVDEIHVYLELDPSFGGASGSFILTDLNGRTLRQWSAPVGSATYSFGLEGVTSGVYLLRFEGDGMAVSRKVVVE